MLIFKLNKNRLRFGAPFHQDFGLYDDPNAFYLIHGSNLSGVKKVIYKHIVRKLMSSNVNAIRNPNP